jgi:hypothetical protein
MSYPIRRETMKLSKVLVAATAFTFLAGSFSVALAAEKVSVKTGTVPQASTVPIVKPCPTAWHLKSGTPGKGRYTCVPDKPAPIQCPAGTKYFDNSEAGCFVGCTEIIK